MAGVRFRKGMHILFVGREYEIDARLRNREYRLRNVVTNEFRAVPELELVEALFACNMEFLGEGSIQNQTQQRSNRTFIEDLAILSDDDPKERARKEEARRRFRYVNAVLAKEITKLTAGTLPPVIDEVAKSINDPNPPCWSTLYNWIRIFNKSGDDPRALLPAWNKRGGIYARYSGVRIGKYAKNDLKKALEVSGIVQEVVDEKFMTVQRRSVRATYKLLKGRIQDINRKRNEDERLPIPHLNSLYNYIARLDVYEVDVARFGRKYADRKHNQVMKSPRPTRPLERVSIDHTKTDLFGVDMEKRLPVGRATLTDALDLYSKMCLGSYLGFEPASYLTVMQCLLNSIQPKTYVKKLYPEVENDWECYGLPEVIIVDNGKEFHSLDFEDACLQLGIVIEYAPPGCPEYKGSKERYYESLNTQLLHNVPGTTFSNILNKYDYDPLKNAVVDVRDLHAIHHLFMVDIYPREYHKGIRDVPARLWSEAIQVYPPALPPRGTDLRVMLGHVAYRQVRREGIELFGLFYNDSSLAPLRRRKKEEKVKVKYDPTDLGVIYVADSDSGRYITVRAVDFEYANGLTLYQHDVIRREARKIAEDYVDEDALWRARKKIEEIVEQSWEKSQKSTTRATLARFKNYGGQTYWGTFEENDEGAQLKSDSEPQEDLLLLNPEASAESSGVSDLPSALPCGDTLITTTDEALESGIIESESKPSSVLPNGNGARNDSKRRWQSQNSINTPVPPEFDDLDDDDLDGEAWDADYGLAGD